jgi:anthranilate synthase component II
MKQILVLDNYDSFTYNLVHMLKEINEGGVSVIRNDEIDLDSVDRYSHVVLSPGPGLPSEAGRMPELVRRFSPTKKILGVCLGHQCIGEMFGAKLHNLSTVLHGKGIETVVTDQEEILFKGIPPRFTAARYHSWVVSRQDFPDCLKITAEDDMGEVTAIRHREYDLCGVQFHPESVLTPDGMSMLKNWLSS